MKEIFEGVKNRWHWGWLEIELWSSDGLNLHSQNSVQFVLYPGLRVCSINVELDCFVFIDLGSQSSQENLMQFFFSSQRLQGQDCI